MSCVIPFCGGHCSRPLEKSLEKTREMNFPLYMKSCVFITFQTDAYILQRHAWFEVKETYSCFCYLLLAFSDSAHGVFDAEIPHCVLAYQITGEAAYMRDLGLISLII